MNDRKSLEDLRASWKGVREAEALVKASLSMSFAFGMAPPKRFRDWCYSLVLVFAYGVLKDTLLQLQDEGAFPKGRTNLKAIMDGSRERLPWVDFAKVNSGRRCRNKVAHKQAIPVRGVSWGYIDAIENELVAWGMLPGPVKGRRSLEISEARGE